MFVLRGTKKFGDRVRSLGAPAVEATTQLGDWYATVLFWRPQVALFVDEQTLLPVLAPLAPASTVVSRLPVALGEVLSALGLPDGFVVGELAEMGEWRVEPTANRSTVGMLNEFSSLAAAFASDDGLVDLVALAVRLAHVPRGPLRASYGFPGQAVAALAANPIRSRPTSP